MKSWIETNDMKTLMGGTLLKMSYPLRKSVLSAVYIHEIKQKKAAPPTHATKVMQPGLTGDGAAAHKAKADEQTIKTMGSDPALIL